MIEELKPCPFCNQAAHVVPDSEHSTAFILGHSSSGCPIDDLWEWYGDEAAAVAAWNKRAKPVVKALVWEPSSTGYQAESPLGYFDVFPATRAGHWYWRHESDAELDQAPPMQRGDDEDEAKAAAQADFTRRVLACLEGYDEV